ncbi:zinc carboxypeptidase [Aquimarina sp. MMG015]|uniref:M14 metallopeptidase family protein n=1 Tax=unclassified Aquimarina TaxID=2627091 RepID=UPI000E4E83C7|nr:MULTISPECIES: M14 metallopeptidase family protein [unclassified Aquimarina]AXT57140.1 zinc carboxypeptidase [Aquimarina sp. AD1]MBQ4801591.1 zinc carboxypeptidase [Aquimarina sp. MMG015]RKN37147.1 zinc carboxypeptidase [Aquimarina sp. AD1]
MKITQLFILSSLISLFSISSIVGQDYFFKDKAPFNSEIPTPEEFLGYPIGEQHTRHDQIVAYLTKLAEISDRAIIENYGKSHENRKLVILTISKPENIGSLPSIKKQHLAFTDALANPTNYNGIPIFVQLGYNVHGNEPSGAEAAMLTAYTLVASNSSEVKTYLDNAIVFIDPTINPDGRDRHTQWANQFKGSPLVSDKYDAEHNEGWPRGRTNHYWFDLNRDWLLAINPESRGKLKWYHEWYPNVVTDFHEMGTNSTYFFEPMKPIGSLDPIMPKENYEDLNNLFAPYFSKALDNIGSFYFTKEAFDGTYPGYGSSYPDLQGALALLFEQASSRGHLQDTDYGTISFPFTIRNQYVSSIATVKAAVENKARLRKYQQDFFKSSESGVAKNNFAGYEFGDAYDNNRNKAFIDKLLLHKIKVYKKGNKYVVPVKQAQKRMVQTVFETYNKYRDSVFYDASAWSVANFYNMKYKGLKSIDLGQEITSTKEITIVSKVSKSDYAYIMNWDDYNAPAALYYMQSKGLLVASAFKPFSIITSEGNKSFNYGSILVPVSKQKKDIDEVFAIVKTAQEKFNVPIFSTNTGFSSSGIDLGSGNFRKLETPKALLLIGEGINSYEAGEVWHLLDTRIHMPITKLRMNRFNGIPLKEYNTLVMVSGRYYQLDSLQQKRIKEWVSHGNTLITIANASKWAIDKKIVKEQLTKKEKDTSKNKIVKRLPYVDAGENIGREQVGGAIFEVDLDTTHPLGFGYRDNSLPVYKNNEVFISPSKNPYATVAKYTKNAHIDGYISIDNYEHYLKPSASLVVSPIGSGRVILFADNPNFRGSWYGTNRLFMNALFLGKHMYVPRVRE